MASQIQQLKDYLRNNPNLKSSQAKQYIDKETYLNRIEEMKKIANDIIYFAKNYFYIISLDQGKCLINPYPKQEQIIRSFTKYQRCIILASRQTGKCLLGDTVITIRNKNTKKIEKITIQQFTNLIKQI